MNSDTVKANLQKFKENLFAKTECVFADYLHVCDFLKADQDGISLDIRNEWTIVNVSDHSIEYGAGIDIEESDHPKFHDLCYSRDNQILWRADGSELIKPSGRPNVIRAAGPKRTIQPGDSLRIAWSYGQSGKRSDVDVMSMGTVTSGVTVKAHFDPAVFNVSFYSLNPYTESVSNSGRTKQWAFAPEQVFLTEQHVQIVWSVVSDSPSIEQHGNAKRLS